MINRAPVSLCGLAYIHGWNIMLGHGWKALGRNECCVHDFSSLNKSTAGSVLGLSTIDITVLSPIAHRIDTQVYSLSSNMNPTARLVDIKVFDRLECITVSCFHGHYKFAFMWNYYLI